MPDPSGRRRDAALGLPVYHFRRTATRDVELRGRRIRQGDKVVMWFASANRDEDVFVNPYDSDVTRRPNDHVTFGKGGPHFCLGNRLARMEVRLMFETLLPRFKKIELAGEVARVRSKTGSGRRSGGIGAGGASIAEYVSPPGQLVE
ncbi:cytochrome P450 [Actinomadura sp. GTD37]|uniref:cytochrome P450 n=1 Tax=Actinomadura sp. GTD37 TaxID=1778030 RepID=UPI0035C00034